MELNPIKQRRQTPFVERFEAKNKKVACSKKHQRRQK